MFTIDLDGSGAQTVPGRVERAIVRSRRKLDYAGLAAEGAGLLEEIGSLREAAERARGGVRLDSPRQAVVADGAGGFQLRWDRRIPVEDWNAQISLLAGSAAASIMLGQPGSACCERWTGSTTTGWRCCAGRQRPSTCRGRRASTIPDSSARSTPPSLARRRFWRRRTG